MTEAVHLRHPDAAHEPLTDVVKQRTREVMRAAMPAARQFVPGLISGVLSAAAAVGLLLVSGWLIVNASVVDSLVPLSLAIVGVRFFAVSRAVFRYLERLAGHDAALRQIADVRADTVRRLIPFAPAGLGASDAGGMLSAMVDDVENLQDLPLRVVQPLLTGGIIAIGSVIVVACVSPAAALVLAACLAIAAVLAILVGWRWGARAERSVSLYRAELSSALTDYLTGLDVLITFGALTQARERVRAADAQLRRTVNRSALAQVAAGAVVSAVAGAATVGIMMWAVPGLAGGAATTAWYAVVVMLPLAVFDIFGAVPQAASAWRKVQASAQRIATVLPAAMPAELRTDKPREVSPVQAPHAPDAGAPSASTTVGGVHLRGVSARWPGQQHPVLQGIDLHVIAGSKVLISGPSGAGKSTLAAALVGFLRAEGQYIVDGVDAATLSGPNLREHIGLCQQQPHLFDLDIRQNLLFARDTATDGELMAVLDRVGLAEWARERGGLDARVGERGSLISGGQAQRLALARALLHDFPVLVLDEPTAGVDPQASDALLRDLLDAASGQTVIVISHTNPPEDTIDAHVRLVNGRLHAVSEPPSRLEP
ncbi:thiol reductant ABC exporter subunit CydC [Microbacterium sp. YY-01]|uniref:thiol reductant ABC exporter subunit CydC n=1 Tax=Microbacterium sp. YY-01 TaxID=3421634 RepID=UPI003D178B3D